MHKCTQCVLWCVDTLSPTHSSLKCVPYTFSYPPSQTCLIGLDSFSSTVQSALAALLTPIIVVHKQAYIKGTDGLKWPAYRSCALTGGIISVIGRDGIRGTPDNTPFIPATRWWSSHFSGNTFLGLRYSYASGYRPINEASETKRN